MIVTPRLRLESASVEDLEAAALGPEALRARLGVADEDDWNDQPAAFAFARDRLAREPRIAGWWTWLFFSTEAPRLAGAGGFAGPPDSTGAVELGYAITPGLRGRGLATEAARGLVEHAWATGAVHSLLAHTLPASNASTRVLEKLGFLRDGIDEDPDEGPVWRWRLTRVASPGRAG